MITLLILFRWFVNYGTMFKTSKIEHSYTAISPTADEDINTVSTESYIEYFFIVRY